MDFITDILFQITIALKIPVVGCLVVAFGIALFETGIFLREWAERRRVAGPWAAYCTALFQRKKSPAELRAGLRDLEARPALVGLFSRQAFRQPDDAAYLEKVMSDTEIEASRRCNLVRLGVRLGPVLGLMGTLIPMGPALMSISTGNMEEMAHDLIIAFSTTVVGLVIGSLSLVMLTVRQHWYAGDMADIESLLQTVFPPREETLTGGMENERQTQQTTVSAISAGRRR
jgi:biopolymer transport protein ExbB/TolQ